MQDARVGVLLLHPHALRERVADHDHARDVRAVGPDGGRAELLRAVASLHRVGRAGGRVVEAGQPQRAVALERARIAQVQVEVAARVARIAVEQDRSATVGDAVRVLEGGRRVAVEAQPRFRKSQSQEGGGGDEGGVRAEAGAGSHPAE